MKKTLSLLRNIILLFIICYVFSSCYSSRLVASVETDELVAPKKTHWTFFWGLIEQEAVDANCAAESISNVTVRDNFVYNLLNVATIGILNPVQFEWHCMPEITPEGEIIEDTIGAVNLDSNK